MKKGKVAFVAPTVYCDSFRLLGFACYEANSEEEARKRISSLRDEGFDLIFTTEDLVADAGYEAVVLPGIKRSEGKEILEKQIEKALGGAVSASFLSDDSE